MQPRTLNRWHWHCPALVVPKIAARSSHDASLAGTTVSRSTGMGASLTVIMAAADPLPRDRRLGPR